TIPEARGIADGGGAVVGGLDADPEPGGSPWNQCAGVGRGGDNDAGHVKPVLAGGGISNEGGVDPLFQGEGVGRRGGAGIEMILQGVLRCAAETTMKPPSGAGAPVFDNTAPGVIGTVGVGP